MDAILLRIVYTVVLLGICGLLLREVWTVWADPQVYVGRFDIVSESQTTPEPSETFAKRIVSAQAVMARQIAEYQTRRSADAPSDVTYLLGGTDFLKVPRQALEGIDITIQSVNLREVLQALRKRFRSPNEIFGNVTVREGSVLAAVDWPSAPDIPNSSETAVHFLTPSRPTPQEAATYIACTITWARAAKANPNIGSFSRAQICDFATALSDLYALGNKGSLPGGLSDEEAALVRRRAAELRLHYESPQIFAEIFRLRADLLDLLPERARTQSELVDAQEDRLRYAMLSPKLSNVAEEKKRLIALALARPAVVIEPGKPFQAPPNWAFLLERHDASIRAVAASTGLVLQSDDTPVGSGFVGAPGVLVTTRFVLAAALGTQHVQKDTEATPPRICFGVSSTQCGSSLTLGKTLFRDDHDESGIVLVDLPGHDALQHPPLPLTMPLPEANTLTGRYAVVVGYPFVDQRMPQEFLHELLGNAPGVKRVMPGRILAFGKVGAIDGRVQFTTDISTTGGTGGGALVDLLSGSILGVSYSGLWQGERGKFAHARPIPAAALEILSRRTRGDPDPAEGANDKPNAPDTAAVAR